MATHVTCDLCGEQIEPGVNNTVKIKVPRGECIHLSQHFPFSGDICYRCQLKAIKAHLEPVQ